MRTFLLASAILAVSACGGSPRPRVAAPTAATHPEASNATAPPAPVVLSAPTPPPLSAGAPFPPSAPAPAPPRLGRDGVLARARVAIAARGWAARVDGDGIVARGPSKGGRQPAIEVRYFHAWDGTTPTDAACVRRAGLLVTMKSDARVEAAAAVTSGAGSGCRVRFASASTAQGEVLYELGGAGDVVEVTCTGDQRGDADPHAECLEVVHAIWAP
jgi:hypothetical protein